MEKLEILYWVVPGDSSGIVSAMVAEIRSRTFSDFRLYFLSSPMSADSGISFALFVGRRAALSAFYDACAGRRDRSSLYVDVGGFRHETLHGGRGRSIPDYRIYDALTIFVFRSPVLFAGTYLRMRFESAGAEFLDLSFETASALDTVGLSSGICVWLTAWGKTMLVLPVFVGRAGMPTAGNAMRMRMNRETQAGKENPAV